MPNSRVRPEPVGATLCPIHAWQVVKLRRQPFLDCDVPTWQGSNGDTIVCDAIANPEQIDAYFKATAERSKHYHPESQPA